MKRYMAPILLLMMLVAFGCGDAEDNNSNYSNFSNSPNTNTDPDAGETDTGGDSGDVGDQDVDADGGPSDIAEGSGCANPTVLGALSAGQEHSFSSALLERSSSLSSSCELGSADAGVHVFSFEAEVDARISIWTSLSPSRLDLRKGGCSGAEEVLTCTSGGTYNFNVGAGETYHLLVWGEELSDFDLRLGVAEALCDPAAPNWCEESMMQECRQGTSIDTTDCLDTCSDGSSCGADACDSAIAIDMSSTSEISYSGDQHSYTSTWSADGLTGCGMSDGADGIDTPNEEVFFEVSGLSAGQQLTVESLSPGDFAFFVLSDCSATSCMLADDADTAAGQVMQWQVPADGSYLVVVEAWQRRARTIELQFRVD